MHTTLSVKIRHDDATFGGLLSTVAVYRRAVFFLFEAAIASWNCKPDDSVGTLKKRSWLERLTHATKKSPDPPFDLRAVAPNLPSYLRRAALAEALGAVSSWKSGDSEKKRKPSAFGTWPVLYAGQSVSEISFDSEGRAFVRIKVEHRGNYRWETFFLNASAARRIASLEDEGVQSPTLVVSGKTAKLVFPIEKKMVLRTASLKRRLALGVDLGVNAAATCSLLRYDGTVASRRFLRLKAEEGRLERAMEEAKRCVRQGLRHCPNVWKRLAAVNEDISRKTAAFILETAKLFHADVIVFECLNLKGKKKHSRRMRLHFWRAKFVQKLTESGAHRRGIRIARVAARNTSAYAFDGSSLLPDGTYQKVERGLNGTHSLCRFPSGKIYNTDLSASYNIGARYFIREILSGLPDEKAAQAKAKVPSLASGITRTLSTLVALREFLGRKTASAAA